MTIVFPFLPCSLGFPLALFKAHFLPVLDIVRLPVAPAASDVRPLGDEKVPIKFPFPPFSPTLQSPAWVVPPLEGLSWVGVPVSFRPGSGELHPFLPGLL